MNNREIAKQLNRLLKKAGAEYAEKKELYESPLLGELQRLLSKNKDRIVFLAEWEDHFSDCLLPVKTMEEIRLKIRSTKTNREIATDRKNFELAASYRDKERNLLELKIQAIIEHNGFKEGFNSFRHRLIVVPPKDYRERYLLSLLLAEGM